MELQKISKTLAELNRQRNLSWDINNIPHGKQAGLAFSGDVYLGMQAENWSEPDMDFANNTIWILSGLYGLLQPNTMILPYRLEMGTALAIGRKANLYKFWQPVFANFVKEELSDTETIVNLASKEYAQAFSQLNLPNLIIEIDFLDYSKGKYKILSFFAKKARGMMANFIVQNRINDWRELKDFNLAGYYFDESRSTNTKLVFLRDKQ
jgi:cytoplasmic iron level regulating protein YaaA (DUF328/UPF0246 family)